VKLMKLCFLSLLSLFSQNNGRRHLLLQNYIILEIIIRNWWSRYQIEACELFCVYLCNKTDFTFLTHNPYSSGTGHILS
jgi:hypothetical protein